MAFLSKVGNILGQTAGRHINAEMSASSPSIFQAIRCMSSPKVFIGGLSYSTDEQSLREAFSKYGYIAEARVILVRNNGRSKGFGFVTFSSEEEASSAIQALDGQDLHSRRVKVDYATDKARGGGFGGGGGCYSGGGGYGGGVMEAIVVEMVMAEAVTVEAVLEAVVMVTTRVGIVLAVEVIAVAVGIMFLNL